MTRLTLIGTVHRDPRGDQRLSALLQWLQPDHVSLEMSPYARDFRLQRSAALRLRLQRLLERIAAGSGASCQQLSSHPAVRDILCLLELPFEYRSASAYCTAEGIELTLVDDSRVSARKLGRVTRSLITRRNLEILVSLPVQATSSAGTEGYLQAARLLGDRAGPEQRQAFLAARRSNEGIGPRDRAMAERIRRIWRQGAGHLVHIGGWVHLLEDARGETLYARLRDLQPQRLLLDGNTPPSCSHA